MLTTVIGAVINIILDPILILVLAGASGVRQWRRCSSQAVAPADIEVPHRPQDHPQAAEENSKWSGTSSCRCWGWESRPSLCSSTESFALHQFQLQPRPLRWRCGCGRDDRHHQRVPALHHAYSGHLSGAASRVTSFNFGAGKKPRVRRRSASSSPSASVIPPVLAAHDAGPGVVAGIFTSDAALIEYTTWAMRIYMAGILAMGVQIACQQSFLWRWVRPKSASCWPVCGRSSCLSR